MMLKCLAVLTVLSPEYLANWRTCMFIFISGASTLDVGSRICSLVQSTNRHRPDLWLVLCPLIHPLAHGIYSTFLGCNCSNFIQHAHAYQTEVRFWLCSLPLWETCARRGGSQLHWPARSWNINTVLQKWEHKEVGKWSMNKVDISIGKY